MLKITSLTVKLLLVNVLQRDDKFTKSAQITKQNIVMLKFTPLTVIFSTFLMKMRNIVKIIPFLSYPVPQEKCQIWLKSYHQLLS